MSDIWSYFKQLFQQAAESSATAPYIHEPISRSPAEKQAFFDWKSGLVCRRFIDWLRGQYGIYRSLPTHIDPTIVFLNTPAAKGFAVHLDQMNYTRQEAIFLLEYFREQVAAIGYKQPLADCRVYEKGEAVETIERYYLKPRQTRPAPSAAGVAQQYGNITIELLLKNDRPHLLKFSTATYHDRQYKAAQPFSELMGEILG